MLPSGTFGDDVRAVGFACDRVAVDLAQRVPATTVITLRVSAATLSSVVMPGKRSSGDTIRGRSNRTRSIVVDGMSVMDRGADLDRICRPKDVMAVAVYAALGGVPTQLGGLSANRCGVVAIWTRR